MNAPRATYRVQLHAGFGFDEVAAIAPYLARLGVSHVYCSPYLQSAPGSTHGYDVVDHGRLNEELGGEAAFERMCAALAESGLSHIVDVVPNHMSVAVARRNAWWWDVLENGPSSRWAAFFDIDWGHPDERLRHRVLLPVLGDHYGRVLEAGDLSLVREGGSFVVRYFEHEVPVSPRTLDELLGAAAEAAGPHADELASIAVALGRLPPADATDRASVEERHRDKEVLRVHLARLLEESEAVASSVDGEVAAVNADLDRLDSLIQRQNYRLAYWRTAGQELDYRRFFDIPELVALRMEDESVFAEAHELVLALVASGAVSGLRIDHPDGLRDPAGYFRRLRAAGGDDLYVVAEKILESDEHLPPSWLIAGTTGYDFLNRVTGLFVDSEGEEQLTEIYARFTGEEPDFPVVAYDAKQEIMRQSLATDLDRLTALAVTVADRHRRYCDYTRRELHDALREIAACFPVYRSYVVAGDDEPSAEDVERVEEAVAEAGRRRPELDPELLSFLRDVLLGRVAGEPESDLAARFQQFTAPVMAKGVEDTAFYRHLRLVALNEVGGDPGRFGTSVADFHRHNGLMASNWPATMLSTSTHDTKRSEDVRARIVLLSEIPGQWALAVRRWTANNDRWRRGAWPDPNTEYLLYQTLVGAWPLETDRAVAYLEKAVKEAKRHTSWVTPEPAYEEAVKGFVADMLADPDFVTDFEAFLRPLVEAGRVTALAVSLLKLTCPGVPDVYQGTELWDLSLVDPDNRRPVDYEVRRRLLDKLDGVSGAEAAGWSDDGASKLWLISRALDVRRRRATAFAPGAAYVPLWAEGEKAHHAVAFVRGTDVAVAVPRLLLGLDGDWADTSLTLPPGRWTDELNGDRSWEGGTSIPLDDLLREFPVALLGRS